MIRPHFNWCGPGCQSSFPQEKRFILSDIAAVLPVLCLRFGKILKTSRRIASSWRVGQPRAVRPAGSLSPAFFCRAKILAEERDHMILKAICHSADVGPVKYLKAVLDSVVVQNFMDLGGIKAQTILVTHV
jgi:hypothetical protein